MLERVVNQWQYSVTSVLHLWHFHDLNYIIKLVPIKPMDAGLLALTTAGKGLVWQTWDDAYTVYQPASAETHYFNETTSIIISLLEEKPASWVELQGFMTEALASGAEFLNEEKLLFAVNRLEALGIVEWVGG